ncbi:restriction endonuclease subunit M [Synergistales bacterium]|nr:restriction endonuclease subunit M [Synergistales bacterium]
MKQQAKPFVKWAGGKAQILDEIRAKYPTDFGGRVNKYAEPFVGGGAVLFDVLNRFDLSAVYISDVNRELITTYKTARDSVDTLISILDEIEREYLPSDDDIRKKIYYAKRERFNHLKAKNDETPEVAALFVFLNRTCFNGLYRVNAKGGYNVPQGSYKNPCICDEDNLRAVSEKLRGVEIVHGDYKLARDFIDERTFAYFDPPYRPLTATASFTTYAPDGFGDKEQTDLARFIDEMSERGAWVVASNSDPKNTDENDDFFDKLYAKHAVLRIEANRAINSVGNGRGRVSELLIARA